MPGWGVARSGEHFLWNCQARGSRRHSCDVEQIFTPFLVAPLALYDFRLTVVKGWRNKKMGIQIGDKAPDFKAQAYYSGTTREIQLSNYRGQWVALLFYPADFTYV